MEEIYSIATYDETFTKNCVNTRLRCMTLLNQTYKYDYETVSEKLQKYIIDWKSLYVASLSDDDTEEQLEKVFKFFGIITKIEINPEKRSAIIYYENLYNHLFGSIAREELEKKMKIDEDNTIHSICIIYTVWQEPFEPIKQRYFVKEFYDHFSKNHKEVKQIRFYDTYMMPASGFDSGNISNYENARKLYETVCSNKDTIKDIIEEIVDEDPAEDDLDQFYRIILYRKN